MIIRKRQVWPHCNLIDSNIIIRVAERLLYYFFLSILHSAVFSLSRFLSDYSANPPLCVYVCALSAALALIFSKYKNLDNMNF